MSSAESKRAEAKRRTMLADALDQEDRAKRLRAEADHAERQAAELRQKADDGTEVLGIVFGVLIVLGVLGWFFVA